MNRLALFALILIALSCLALMEAKATNNGLPLVSADYQACAPIPFQPNKPNFHPFGRKPDRA
jgi:hypothetical protein